MVNALKKILGLMKRGSSQPTELLLSPENFDPPHVESMIAEGNRFEDDGKLDQALEIYFRASKIAPENPAVFLNLGNVALEMGQLQDAITYYQEAIRFKPDYASAHFNLGRAFSLSGSHDRAITSFEKGLDISPQFTDAWVCLGNEREDMKQLDKAEDCFIQALKTRPDYPEVLFSLGRVSYHQAKFQDAIFYSKQAIALREDYALAHNVLADALKETFQFQEAITHLQRVIDLDPYTVRAPYSLGYVLLSTGVLAKGWELYEYRFDTGEASNPNVPRNCLAWEGDKHQDKDLIVWAEQGLGDEIMFSSLYSDLVGFFRQVSVTCDKRLIPLFQRSFPTIKFISRCENLGGIDADYQIAIGSLPRYLRSSIESFTNNAEGYLKAVPALVQKWHDWLNSLGNGIKTGICWRSGMRSDLRDRYYSSLNDWQPIFNTHGVQFINLQYGEAEDELKQAEQQYGITIHRPPGINLKDDLDEVAALTVALDLVVSPGTAVSAMAGALGKEVWMFTLESEWTMLGTEQLPWLSSIRVYRKIGDVSWQNTFDRIAIDLAHRVGGG
jgi:tetratricopeptide (TPR) repeat protein